MVAFLNNVQLIGYLGKDPDFFDSKHKETEFAIVSLATNEPISNQGLNKNSVEWHQLIFFENMSVIAKSLKKGAQIFVEGSLCSHTWMDPSGRKHKNWNIAVKNVQLLSSPCKEKPIPPIIHHKTHTDDHTIELADSHILSIKEMLKKK